MSNNQLSKAQSAAMALLQRYSPAVGGLTVLALWWLIAALFFASSKAVPTPLNVVQQFFSDGWSYYATNIAVTVRTASVGFLLGNGVALVLSLIVIVWPRTESSVMSIAVVSQCLPITAIGPILLIVFMGRTPSMLLAALVVFFTTLVGVLLGVRSTDRSALELIDAYGGGRFIKLRKVQSIAALPALISALKIAAPTAILGAIIGEYLGGVDSGVGVALTVAQRQLETARAWALVVAVGLIGFVAYGLFTLLGRIIAPWSAMNQSQP